MFANRLMPILFLIIWFISTVFSSVYAQKVNDLVYMTEDYAPANYLENGKLKGYSVEILKLIWKKMGYPEQKINVFPWARSYSYVMKQKNHVLFSMARTKDRENLFKWVGPICTSRQVLIALADKKIKLSKIEDVKKYNTGAIIKDVAGMIVKKSGFAKKLQSVSRLSQNIQKLELGRIDLIAYSEQGLYEYLKLNRIDTKKYETVFVLQEIGLYYTFHKATPDSLINSFQKAIDNLHDEHMKILKKYNQVPWDKSKN
ncbi:MAG: amino acid ABC transporter substrate-binding protein [Desulfobacterales bacterium]|nr:amino acid ABC transporter substrate-binding protein [Desulfobacterales bacterium]MCP4164255.1 amino acid ABC transporter substrate-binding protein [Deltaproteobacteria bacterium]